MPNWADLARDLVVERNWKRVLAFAGAALVLFLTYRQYEVRHQRSRLDDLLLLERVVESALSDAWQVLGRRCAEAPSPAECEKAEARLSIAPDPDRLGLGLERLRLCRGNEVCRDIPFADLARQLDLERSFRDLLVLDGDGIVLASGLSAGSTLSRLEAGGTAAGAKDSQEPGRGVAGLFAGLRNSLQAAPALVPVTLGGEELELAWTLLQLPATGAEAPDYKLAGITYRPPPGFEKHESLVWYWVFLGALMLLPVVSVVRVFRGTPEKPILPSRSLLVAVLCMTLSAIALGVTLLAVAERRPVMDREKARAKDLRDRIRRQTADLAAFGSRSLRAVQAEVDAASAAVFERGGATCGFSPELREDLERFDAVAFLTNASGDQLCLERAATAKLVNRADRDYFSAVGEAGRRDVAGPIEIVNQQTGERNWVFGSWVPRRPVFGEVANGVRAALKEPADRHTRFAFVAAPARICPEVEDAVCFVVDRAGRIVFSNSPAFALSGVDVLRLVTPGFVLESRMQGPASYTERVRLRGEQAIASIRDLRVPRDDYFSLAVVSLTPHFEALQHALASIARWAFFAWLLPLFSLSLLSRVAASNLVDVLLPSAAPRERYALGAASLTIVGLAGLAYALMFLDPLRQLLVAGVVAFGAPLLAFAVLGSAPVAETLLPDWMKSPRLVFCWYLPLFALGTGGLLAWGAFELEQPGAVVLAGLLVGAAGLVPWSLAVRRGAAEGRADEARPSGRRESRWSAVPDVLRRNHRLAYAAAVGSVFWFLACMPTALVTHAVLETLRLAEGEVERVSQEDARTAGLPPKPTKGTSRILVGNFDLEGERRVAVLQRLEDAPAGRVWRRAGVRLPYLTAVLLWALGVLAWWAICRRTFGWGFEGLAARGEVEGERRDHILAAVQRGGLPAWLLSGATSRLLAAGLLDNRDGLRLTESGVTALRAAEDRRASAPPPQAAESAPKAARSPASAIPAWTYAVAAVPLGIWLLGSPDLLGNVALWTATILSASRMGPKQT